MAAAKWKAFPYETKSYLYEGAAHKGDREPFPDAAFVSEAFRKHAKLRGALDAEKTAAALQSACDVIGAVRVQRSQPYWALRQSFAVLYDESPRGAEASISRSLGTRA